MKKSNKKMKSSGGDGKPEDSSSGSSTTVQDVSTITYAATEGWKIQEVGTTATGRYDV
jgi:hypothetical protein